MIIFKNDETIILTFLIKNNKELLFMSEAKLINYSTADFGAKADMELRLFKWQDQKEEYLPMLEAGGMLRFTTMRVWNKEGVFRLGYLFEYKDEESYKKCQLIWQEIEKNMKAEMPVKVFANRGIVLDDIKFY